MKNYLIIGGGHQGIAMSAHLALSGYKVNLWNRTKSNIQNIIDTKQIEVTGVVSGVAKLNKVSSNIDDVLEDFIFVTTPVLALRDIAKMLAPRVTENNIIVLTPGRTFGSLEFEKVLKEYGCKSLPKIAETQTIIHTCRKVEDNIVNIIALKNKVKISSLNRRDINYIWDNMPEVFKKNYVRVNSFLDTSLNNVGLLLHCTPTLLNTGWIENENFSFKYYKDGITPSIADYIENIDNERIQIGNALNIKLEKINEWFYDVYNIKGTSLLECINNEVYNSIEAPTTINYRYLNEDIPFGLVPLENLAQKLNINTPYISTIITLGSLIMKKDYRREGINISNDFLNKIREANNE